MTAKQRIEAERSELRQKMATLLGKDELSAEERAELDKATKRLADTETELRAADALGGDDEPKTVSETETRGTARNGADGESAELRKLLETATLSGYLEHASDGSKVDGAEAELSKALELRSEGGAVAVPWEMLAGPEPTETRASTTTAALDGGTVQRTPLQRLFGRGILDVLGVRVDSVPVGMSEWPLLTGGVAPAQTAEDTAAPAAVTAAFATQTLKPKRLTGRYEFTAEMAAQVRALEPTLRRDLSDAIMSKMSDQILNGDGSGANVTGFLNRLTKPTDPTTEATYADYAKLPASAVDGLHAETEGQVGVLLGVDVYQHAAGVFQTGSGEAGIEAINRRCRSCRSSSYVAAAASGISSSNILHAAGPNGGMMRGDSIAAVWPSLNIIRDIYTKAADGVTVLTYIMLWDAYTAFRSDAYKRVSFKLTA